jgi:hypothetical protein
MSVKREKGYGSSSRRNGYVLLFHTKMMKVCCSTIGDSNV